jgi:hypothetical protein
MLPAVILVFNASSSPKGLLAGRSGQSCRPIHNPEQARANLAALGPG